MQSTFFFDPFQALRFAARMQQIADQFGKVCCHSYCPPAQANDMQRFYRS